MKAQASAGRAAGPIARPAAAKPTRFRRFKSIKFKTEDESRETIECPGLRDSARPHVQCNMRQMEMPERAAKSTSIGQWMEVNQLELPWELESRH